MRCCQVFGKMLYTDPQMESGMAEGGDESWVCTGEDGGLGGSDGGGGDGGGGLGGSEGGEGGTVHRTQQT